MNTSTLELVLDGLMRRYTERVPDVGRVLDVMTAEGIIKTPGDIENDHIAFRSLGIPHLGIASLEKIFLALGYVKKDYYHFPEKKLDAYWYAPPTARYPRIFLSQLRVQDLSRLAQGIIDSYTKSIHADPVDALDLSDGASIDTFLHSSLWPLPTLGDYETLASESEYAAWVIYNRYYLNHFTISVHNLPEGYNTIAGFNDFLERHGFTLNSAGGKIKQSPDGLLLQSATVAGRIEALGPFELLTRGDELPVFAFTLKPGVESFSVFDVSSALRERGWQVPAYTFPKNREDIAALRIVVKRGFSHDMADLLVEDLTRAIHRLEKQNGPGLTDAGGAAFHH